MQRNAFKYLIDALLFVGICSLCITGAVLALILPGGRGPDGNKFFLGLHRHQWGNMHLVLALLLLLLLLIHLWLNWRWVVKISERLFAHRWQRALALLSMSWVLVLALGWLLVRCG